MMKMESRVDTRAAAALLRNRGRGIGVELLILRIHDIHGHLVHNHSFVHSFGIRNSTRRSRKR